MVIGDLGENVAVGGEKLFGSANLVAADLPPRPQLTPWLAQLFVAPARRRAGVAPVLVSLMIGPLLFAVLTLAQIPPGPSELERYAGLHRAAARGDVAEITRLLAQGADPNARDGNGRTPLHVAVFGSHAEVARALVRGGADPNALDAQRYDIVTIAAVKDDVRMVQLALALGASP